MPVNEFVIRLARGEYMTRPQPGDMLPHATPDIDQAQRFPTRWAALGICGRGPASFFDHAAIVPYRPQDEPAAAGRLQRSPEPQDEPQQAPGVRERAK